MMARIAKNRTDGWRCRPSQGVCERGRRRKMVAENDPEGVAFVYPVIGAGDE
jgi:hypothetical protein